MDDRQITDSAPLPLARAFRRYWNAAGARDRHDAAYYLFEILLKYLASIAIARYVAGERRDHRVNAALKGLVRPSLGEWLRFLRETLRFLADGSGEPDPLAKAMAELFAGKATRPESVLRLHNLLRAFLHGASGEKTHTSLGALLEDVVAYRNRVMGHGAPLDEGHYRQFAGLFGDAFAAVIGSSPFLTALRLVSFPSVQVEGGSRIECEVLEHVGLQPARRSEPLLRSLAEGSVPQKNVLYLLDPAGSLVLLDPLLIAHRDDVYFLNEAEGAPEYLSYSSGERHRPTGATGAQGELFGRILGYQPDPSRLGRMGEDLEPNAAATGVPPVSDAAQRLGDYRVVREVGRGAMGVVFEAYQESLGRRVALKVLPGSFALDAKRVERFHREARATARIHHPSIVPVYEVGESAGTHFFSMEFIDGPSLAHLLDEDRREAGQKTRATGSSISEGQALARTLEQIALVAEGLEEANSHGLVHRDVKPSNILIECARSVDRGGRYVLVDFGLVRDEGAQALTRSGEMVGTLGYMSPEQVSRRPVDRRSDVYSLGATLYEVLTLRTPFGGEGASEHAIQDSILYKEPTAPRKLKPRLSRDLETVVLKALEKDPDRRYASAGEFAADLRRHLRGEPIHAKPASTWTRISRSAARNRLRVGLAASVLVAAAAIGVTAWIHVEGRAQKVARENLLPEIERLVEKDDFLAAYHLARQAERTIPGDPVLTKLWPRLSWIYTITTDPPGADIFYKEYTNIGGEWIHLGAAPIEKLRFPRGVYRWRVQHDGFETREFGPGRGTEEGDNVLRFQLEKPECHPPGMVWIDAAEFPAYWIDQYEITNEQFKEFVDGGGYRDPQFWMTSFVREGRELSWEDAMASFRDGTGLPGPSTWEKGGYPQDHGKHPVAGVSWYEAEAYARFKGKSLPTTHHWYNAACPFEASLIIRFSNFGDKGTAPVGRSPGIGITGLYDMAGNVKEWCYNATDDSGSRRYLLGGAWGEETYSFTIPDAQSPWDRSATNGFRCVSHPKGGQTVPELLSRPIESLFKRDYKKIKPVSNEEFEFYKSQHYAYDRTDLKAVVESVDDTADFWRMEKISFNAAYGGERMPVYLFLPKGFKPRYQAVILFPGSNAVTNEPFPGLERGIFTEFVIRSGRALMVPIYKGTYERFVENRGSGLIARRDRGIQRTKDLRRAIDYLETRDDIDKDKIAYYGLSWGAVLGPISLAVEPRLKLGILVIGGLTDEELHPANDPVNFVPHVKVPVLMVNGVHDMYFPVEESQRPMFDLLGTPAQDKKHAKYPGGHGVNALFSREIRGEVLGWLDRYLGPVSN